MKAYIDVRCVNPGAHHTEHDWTADVVTEQDYHERGPHAHSYRTNPMPDAGMARDAAKEWAEELGYIVVSVDDI